MAQDAGGLHCPNCGGPASAGDRVCRFCRAELATISCPKCFALMFAGAAYCPQCGARAERGTPEAATTACPGCRRKEMRNVEVGPADLLECAHCGGVWVEAAAFEQICADREAQASVLHQWSAPAPARAERVQYRPCPQCGRMMNRLNFGKLSGAVVDVCKGHGTFLDAGELHRIVSFIQSGGLERARQRQIEDLKDAEAQLRAAEQAQGLRDSAIASDWQSQSSWNGPDLLELLRRIKS
jgi:Zn-finger nucleic acid-binding protein